METEEELLHELRAGSRNAGRRLYERYSGGLMAVCLRYLGGRDEARPSQCRDGGEAAVGVVGVSDG